MNDAGAESSATQTDSVDSQAIVHADGEAKSRVAPLLLSAATGMELLAPSWKTPANDASRLSSLPKSVLPNVERARKSL